MAQRISYFRALVLAVAATATAACGPSSVSNEQSLAADDIDDEGDGDRDDCKLEGERIGEIGASVDLGNLVVIVDSWLEKDGEPGEYVGFTFHTSTGASVAYTVKAGGESYDADTTTWVNPSGTGGPEVSAVSNIDFCDGCTDPDGCEPGDGGDGECDNPDGCDPGDGGDGECNDPDGCGSDDGGEIPTIP